MPWFKVDDGFHGHPKVVDLSLSAVGIWTLAGSWCAKYLTDGDVSQKAITRMGGDDGLAAELVEAGLWIPAVDGYAFKDWADYQPLKIDIEAERAAAQERMRSVRARKKGVRANETRTTGERSDEHAPKFGGSSEDVRVTPSHPIPVPSQSPKERPATRGSRLPTAWVPSAETVAVIKTECPSVDPKTEHAVFVDYWIAQPGQKGVKTDWDATWRNWMRRKQADTTKGAKPTKEDQVLDVLELGRRMQADEDRKAVTA
jgi:hypothetical protein